MIITIHSFIAACAMASNASAENSLGSTMAFSTIQSGGRRRLARRPGDGSLMSTSASIAEGEIADCPDDESYVVEFRTDGSDAINDHRFNANAFASSNCWGRRPFLMRNAFDPHLLLDDVGQNHDERGEEATFAWPSWEEVVEIAADEDSESRIISHVTGDHTSFELRWGPLSGDDTTSWISKASNTNTNKRRETLVVNDVDRFYPPLANWIHETFRFLPNWRMDDGQISLAERGGGIGPHVDNYDVFLIQMSGTRTWQVGRRSIDVREERDRMIDCLDVRVLEDWSSVGKSEREQWIVNPGDLLYLPPRIAHCGTALSSDCMTLSVGCRAPSVSDIVSKLAERLSSSIEDSAVRRYTDEDLLRGVDNQKNTPGELTYDAKERAKLLVIDSLTSIMSDDEWWDEFFGSYVTEPKRVRNDYPIPLEDWGDDSSDSGNYLPDKFCDVQSVLAGRGVLYQAEGVAFAYSSVPSKTDRGQCSHRFYANGEMWRSESESSGAKQNDMAKIFQLISNHRRIDRAMLLGNSGDHDQTQQHQLTPEAVQFLQELVDAGVLYGSDE